jgi:hypothetical protein
MGSAGEWLFKTMGSGNAAALSARSACAARVWTLGLIGARRGITPRGPGTRRAVLTLVILTTMFLHVPIKKGVA